MRGSFVIWAACGILALILLAMPIAAAGGGCVNHTPANDGVVPTIAMKDCSFAPTVSRVATGAAVTWTNDDYLPHVISGIGWGSGAGYTAADVPLQPGGTYTYMFTKAGIYPYACYLHPGMSGVVIVGDVDTTTVPAGAASGAATPATTPTRESWAELAVIGMLAIVAIGGGIALIRRF